MEKINFSELVKQNRKAIFATGEFSHAILTRYIQGTRTPTYERAKIIAAVCDVPIMALPWSRREVNRP